jgi:hypothetical protein
VSWAKVAASVKCPPPELFIVVVAINPARARSDTDRMTKATRISINVKPFDFLKSSNASPPESGFGFGVVFAKPVPMDSDYWKERECSMKLYNGFHWLGAAADKLREEHMPR